MAKPKNGWKKLPKVMQFCARKYPEVMNRFAVQETEVLKGNIVSRTPVDTGRLRAGFHSMAPGYDGGRWTIAVCNNVEYAEYVEYGHRWAKDAAGRNVKLEDPGAVNFGFTKGRFMARDGAKATMDGMQGRYKKHIEAFFDAVKGALK